MNLSPSTATVIVPGVSVIEFASRNLEVSFLKCVSNSISAGSTTRPAAQISFVVAKFAMMISLIRWYRYCSR